VNSNITRQYTGLATTEFQDALKQLPDLLRIILSEAKNLRRLVQHFTSRASSLPSD
jgi:hypothetical protein